MAVEPAVDRSIDSLPDGRRETVRAVHARVQAEVPELDVRIRFKKLEDLDLDVTGELCRRAAELVAAGRFAM